MNLIEIIADAGFYVSQRAGTHFDAACDLCRSAAADAMADGITFTAEMLADVVCDLYA